MFDHSELSNIESEIEGFGGTLAWVSPHGVGVDYACGLIGDDELLHMPATIQNAVWLNLAGTRITDASCHTLTAGRCLEELDVSRTELTLDGLSLLKDLSVLVEIHVADTFTDDDIHALSMVIPKVRITKSQQQND